MVATRKCHGIVWGVQSNATNAWGTPCFVPWFSTFLKPTLLPAYWNDVRKIFWTIWTFLWLRYTTFNHVYKERWYDILRFRSRSLFTTCEVCCAFKSQLQDRSISFEQKLGCLQGYRSHLHDQYCDRTVIWTLQSEGSDPNSGILMICTDGLDQAKFALPYKPTAEIQCRVEPGPSIQVDFYNVDVMCFHPYKICTFRCKPTYIHI